MLDVNDTFSTGGTISYDNADGTITINGNQGFTPYAITWYYGCANNWWYLCCRYNYLYPE